MTAFDHSALWNKAKMFIDRALSARDHSDEVGYHLWAATAMEVIGKAALSFVHPTLVADPSHLYSLMTAAGKSVGTERRSITARTVFERLQLVVPSFDKKMADECMLMANRRNAELHSGETPIVGLNVKNWVPHYWRSVDTLVCFQAKSLDELIGTDEAARVREILRDAAELTRQTVLARLHRCAIDIDQRYPQGTSDRIEAERRSRMRPLPPQYQTAADSFDSASCPSCSMNGWLFGTISDEEIHLLEESDGDYGPSFIERIETTYAVEEFRCPECSFRVVGRDEVSIARLPAIFVHEEERVPDYDPEYGND